METTKQLTDSQKRALELIGRLADEGKIEMSEAIQLIIAIYENEKEIVYIPYQSPYPNPYPWTIEPYKDEPYRTPYTIPNGIPWWERNKIWCSENNTNSAQGESGVFTYAINDEKEDDKDKIKEDPRKEYHRKKNKSTGKPTKNYYDKNGENGIPPEEYKRRVRVWKKREKNKETSKETQESLTLRDYIKMIFG